METYESRDSNERGIASLSLAFLSGLLGGYYVDNLEMKKKIDQLNEAAKTDKSKFDILIGEAKSSLEEKSSRMEQQGKQLQSLIREIEDLTTENRQIKQANLELRTSIDVLMNENELLKQSMTTNSKKNLDLLKTNDNLLKSNEDLNNHVNTLNSQLKDYSDRLNTCSLNLMAIINQSESEMIRFINNFCAINSFDIDIPLLSFQDFVDANRQVLLEKLKSIVCIVLFKTPSIRFNFTSENELLGSYSTKAFVSFMFMVLYELNKKKVLV